MFSDGLPIPHYAGHPEVAYLDLAIVREQNIVEFDVSMDDGTGMAVAKGDHDLFED